MSRERIEALKAQLPADDARASIRGQIAGLYLSMGDHDSAVDWFLEAVRHAEWSEMGLTPLAWAKMAARANPSSGKAWTEYERQWKRAGLPEPADLLEPL